ncbi:ABC transporter substrate-binding protein [Roseomonas aeriglobus]|nr:ABC transporter substrate-binding protein [Roseomonas aeriglobus]
MAALSRDDVAAAADREGVVEIWSTTDLDRVKDLLADFRRLHPRIKVVYSDVHGSDLQTDFLRAARGGGGTADLLWSSAMDLQIKLVNDGHAATYRSPEAANLPDWAKWKDQAWGITAEPIVIVYNKRLIARDQVPTSHIGLRKFLESGPADGRRAVATYDISRSAVGYLYLSQDEQASSDVWRLVRAMGRDRLKLYTSAEDILRDVSAGSAAIGYNIVGSYALDEMSRHADLGVIMPQDYTLVMSRIAMIPNRARHPAAARLFLDFLLSRSGQRRLAEHHITPARSDVIIPAQLQTPAVPLRAIRVGPALLVTNDRLTRSHFLALWRQSLSPSTL